MLYWSVWIFLNQNDCKQTSNNGYDLADFWAFKATKLATKSTAKILFQKVLNRLLHRFFTFKFSLKPLFITKLVVNHLNYGKLLKITRFALRCRWTVIRRCTTKRPLPMKSCFLWPRLNRFFSFYYNYYWAFIINDYRNHYYVYFFFAWLWEP